MLPASWNLGDVEKELIVGITVAGALVSAAASGVLGDKYGRRRVVIISSCAFIFGSVVMACSNGLYMLLIGRFIVGLGVGSASMMVPVLLAECAPAENRGWLVTCVNAAITFGQLVACCVAGGFSGVESGWRYMLGLAAFPAAIQLIGFMCWVPESPRWLVENGMIDRGTVALRQLREAWDVREEMQEILSALQQQRDATEELTGNGLKRSTWSLLAEKTTYRALMLGCMMQIAQQLGGINTVMYYSASILTMAGANSNAEAIWLSIGVSGCNFVGSVVGLFLVERVGRRKLTCSA